MNVYFSRASRLEFSFACSAGAPPPREVSSSAALASGHLRPEHGMGAFALGPLLQPEDGRAARRRRSRRSMTPSGKSCSRSGDHRGQRPRHHSPASPDQHLGDAQGHRLHAAHRRVHAGASVPAAVGRAACTLDRMTFAWCAASPSRYSPRPRCSHADRHAADLRIGMAADVTSHRPAFRERRAQHQRRLARVRRAHARRRECAPHSGPRPVLARDRSDHLGIQAAPRREVPRRLGFHRRGRGVLARAPGDAHRQSGPVHRLRASPSSPRRSSIRCTDAAQDRHALRDAAVRPQLDLHRVEEGGGRRHAPRISTAARRRSAPARTGSCASRAATASNSRATTPTGAASKARAWDKVTLRIMPADRRASPRCSRATWTRSRTCRPPISPALKRNADFPAGAEGVLAHHVPAPRPVPRPPAPRHRQGGQAAGERNPFKDAARAAGAVQGDQPHAPSSSA